MAEKTCKATRTDGDVYDVFFPDGTMDTCVPGHYLTGLQREGWTIEVYDRQTREREALPAGGEV